MKQKIIGFYQDELGDWIANLACQHGQHVRHNPPLVSRLWVLTSKGRTSFIGHELDCTLCDQEMEQSRLYDQYENDEHSSRGS
jgi:hypothetical protein